jgi:hypothetical protein
MKRRSNIIDEIGNKYGKLLITERANNRVNNSAAFWTYLCDCGNTGEVEGTYLRRGKRNSCGCAVVKNEIGNKYGNLIVTERIPNKLRPKKVFCYAFLNMEFTIVVAQETGMIFYQ